MKRWNILMVVILLFTSMALGSKPVHDNGRVYNHFPDGLYIIEGGDSNFYSMTLINEMTIAEKNDLITAILTTEDDACWFVIANYHGFFSDFSGGIANWPEDDQAMEETPELFYNIEDYNMINISTGEVIHALPLKQTGPEGPLSEVENVYNIIDESTLLGTWSVSIQSTRLPESYMDASGWKIEINGNEYFFTENPFDDEIFETTIPDTMISSGEEIRNSLFSVNQE